MKQEVLGQKITFFEESTPVPLDSDSVDISLMKHPRENLLNLKIVFLKRYGDPKRTDLKSDYLRNPIKKTRPKCRITGRPKG